MQDILHNRLYLEDLKIALKSINLSKIADKSVCITGGLGLIGAAIVDLLIENNYLNGADSLVYVACRSEEAFALRYGNYPCVKFLQYDAMKPITFDTCFDYIVHCAGVSSPEMYIKKPVETMLSNFNGVLNLLNYAKVHNVKRVLYVSSSEVYGIKSTEEAFVEERFGVVSINTVRSSYSEAKRASEVLCRSYASEYDVDVVMVRPGHIYGPTASEKDNRIVSQFAYLAAKGEELKMYSSGCQKRSYCYSVDCAVSLLYALLYGEKGEAYNIGHDEITSIYEMAQIIARAGKVKLTMDVPTEEDLERSNPMDNSVLDNSKIKEIGYRDSFSVRDGLTHTVAILKENEEEDL